MAASAAHAASKSSKKKAAKAVERAHSPAPSTASGAADKPTDAHDSFESPYIKELQKNIRNLNKKISHASKTDILLTQHPGKDMDYLVAAKVINADQKAQVLKKPALQAQVAQLEEQLAQHQKAHEQYCARLVAEKAEWEKSLDKAKDNAVSEAKQDFNKSLHEHLLTLSQFLRLAAYRREEAKDPESDESQAIEGVLLAIYAGDESAVASMLKLIEGSTDQILSVPGEQLQTTYSNIRALAREYKTPFYAESAQPTEPEPPAKEAASDPTATANAAAAEIDAGEAAPLANGQEPEPAANGTASASVSDDAANVVAETHWDGENDTSISQEWVDLKAPRGASETETGLAATPPAAPAANTRSWADDQPDAAVEVVPAAADPNDGFHQVQRNRGRHDREGGGWRGRGRGEWRGRGRGDGRGRGRGRGNGGMPSRGPRRSDES